MVLTIGRIFAGNGWRYLWDQVAGEVGGDYYLLDIRRGESPGQWAGTAAEPELGVSGRVSEEQMRKVFGRLAHPVTEASLGRPPLIFRSVEERLAAARTAYDRAETARWAQRELVLLEAGTGRERIDQEQAAFRARADERWTAKEAAIHRGGQRQAVAGFDLTFSAPKSVSVLWASAPGWGRQKIWDAHHEGVAAAMRFVEREAALSRSGYQGVRQVDTTGLITASFDHRMSRAGDVHLHTHTATLNRVRCADGEWRAIDGRAIYRVAAAAGAIYDRVREAALERDLGVRHELDPSSGAREIVGVDAPLRRLFSARRVQIEGRLDELVAAWRAEHGGAEPSEWMVTRMAEWARLETRAPKGPGESTESALARWDAQCRAELGRSLTQVWAAATNSPPGQTLHAGLPIDSPTGRPAPSNPPTEDDLIAAAVNAVDEAKSTWTRYDLAREITRRLQVDPDQPTDTVLTRVDTLVTTALGPHNPWGVISLAAAAPFDSPPTLRRASDNASLYTEHGADRYTTNTGLAIEHRLLTAARDTTGPRLDHAAIDGALTATSRLEEAQAAAVTAVATSGRRLDVLVGPAGTGKTTTMGALAQAWTGSGRQVLGLSIAENATRVLAAEAGIPAVNAAKLIFEHTQRPPRRRKEKWWQATYAIKAGALVILDEAGMASRQTIDQLTAICSQVGAKLLLVGDPEQLPSPDAGGAFELVANRAGAATLGQVRRFNNGWERAASLRLRAGDPAVLDDYDRRGRIHGGSLAEMEDAAFAAAMADRARGLDSFLQADTNDTVARLARRVRDQLIAAGTVNDTVTVTLADGNRAGVGDRIVTRDNDRTNRTDDGRFVANRDQWTIHAITTSGGLIVTRVGTDHTVELEAGYVADRVQLGYATTIHAVQGGTADTAHVVLTPRSSRTSAHVGLTRGRDENHAYVVISRPEGADVDGPANDPMAVLADILERPDPPDSVAALQVQTDNAERAVSLASLYPVWQDLIAQHGSRGAQQALHAIAGSDLAAATIRSPAWPALAARLRRLEHAGIDPNIALASAAAEEPLEDADDLAAVLHWRLRHTETTATNPAITFTALTPTGPGDIPTTTRQVAKAMDIRTAQLAYQTETNPPVWVHLLGPQPSDPTGRHAWLDRAAVVAGYRETFNITTTDDPIGAAPTPDRVDAHAWWARAAAALTNSPTQTLNRLPTERLDAIIDQAHTHLATAPPNVANRLRATTTAVRAAHTRLGTALAHNDQPTAAVAAAESARLARQLDRLEATQTRRDQWDNTNARLENQAAAAQTVLDHRHAIEAARPHRRLDTATLIARLQTAQRRTKQAATTAERYDQQATRTAAAIAALDTDIDHTVSFRPAETQARHTILAEQAAAARITTIRSDLDATRLGRRTAHGNQRARLLAELRYLQTQHPALFSGADPTTRWDTLQAAGQADDDAALTELRADHHRANVDLDWYHGTSTSLRADAEQQAATITSLRAELATRTGAPQSAAPNRRQHPRAAAKTHAPADAIVQGQAVAAPRPPQDSPGAGGE